MSRIITPIIIIVISFCSCQQTERNKSDEKVASVEDVETESPPSISGSSNLDNEANVVEYLKDAGFLMEVNGKKVYREDQLGNASSEEISSSIVILSKNAEENKMAIFYLKVAGSGLDNEEEGERFIGDVILSDDQYLDHVDRMVKFLQRQDRPVIKKALLGTIEQMSPEQCVDYLLMAGYVSGSDESDRQYQPKVLKSLPIDLKLALLNNLKSAEEEASIAVYEQLKKDMGVNS